MQNLERAIRWTFNRETENWCGPHDGGVGHGCNWWTHIPPARGACLQCPVQWFFCDGCARATFCAVHPYPKIWPEVGRFLTRFNVARQMNQSLHGFDWRETPMREWLMMQVALATVNECERKRVPKGAAGG